MSTRPAPFYKQFEERTYAREACIVFYKTREAFGGLSNMAAGYPLQVGPIRIPTSEALYQACRFPHLPDVQATILRQASPMAAKMKSKPYRQHTRDDWERVSIAIMNWCLEVKLVQHRRVFGALLESTLDRPIVEQSHKDRFWGAVPDAGNANLTGRNVLGQLLSNLRDRVRANPAAFRRIEPLVIDQFHLLGRPIEAVCSA
jgi:ribA/ribD-fused uncharacterized protein